MGSRYESDPIVWLVRTRMERAFILVSVFPSNCYDRLRLNNLIFITNPVPQAEPVEAGLTERGVCEQTSCALLKKTNGWTEPMSVPLSRTGFDKLSLRERVENRGLLEHRRPRSGVAPQRCRRARP
jgi:hypothetical protein